MYRSILSPEYVRSRWEKICQENSVGPKKLERYMKRGKVSGSDSGLA